MIGQTIVRLLLVITLIVSAHFIRPFSVNNFTNHFIQSSKTFKSILPESQSARFDHANLLAMTLNQILFAGEQREEDAAPERSVDVVLNNRSENPSCSDENDPPVKTTRPEILAKRSIRIEPAERLDESISLPTETYKIEREVDLASTGSRPLETEAETETDEASRPTYVNASSPVILPVVRTNKCSARLKLRPLSTEPLKIIPNRYHLLYQPRKVDCDYREKRIVNFMALVYLEKSIISILGCEREETGSETIESHPVNSETKYTEMQESEPFDLFMPQPKAESCSID